MYEFNWQGCSYEVSQAPVLGDQVIALPGGTIVHPFMNNPIACRIEVSSAHPGDQHKDQIQATERDRRGRGVRVH